MVPAPPVWSISGAPAEPVEWVMVSPESSRLPLVEITLLERLTSFWATTFTLPLPVVMVWLTCTLPLVATAGVEVVAYSETLPEPVVRVPGVVRLPSRERNSMLPVVVVRFSVASTSWVPAMAVIEVLWASLPVRAFMLSWLASRIDTWLPVEVTVTWPVKSLRALSRVMLPVLPKIEAVVDLIDEPVVWDTATPFSTMSTPVASTLWVSRSSTPSVVSMLEAAPATTLPVSLRPAVPAPPRSFRVSAPVVMKLPRLSR